jgi:hypothetical protein
MPEHRIPKLSHHKASGKAIVRLNGKDFYLGLWRSRAARLHLSGHPFGQSWDFPVIGVNSPSDRR